MKYTIGSRTFQLLEKRLTSIEKCFQVLKCLLELTPVIFQLFSNLLVDVRLDDITIKHQRCSDDKIGTESGIRVYKQFPKLCLRTWSVSLQDRHSDFQLTKCLTIAIETNEHLQSIVLLHIPDFGITNKLFNKNLLIEFI